MECIHVASSFLDEACVVDVAKLIISDIVVVNGGHIAYHHLRQ